MYGAVFPDEGQRLHGIEPVPVEEPFGDGRAGKENPSVGDARLDNGELGGPDQFGMFWNACLFNVSHKFRSPILHPQSTQLNDGTMRELLYDIVQMVAQTNLLAVIIGQDSPEQLINNYRTFMSLLFNPDLDYSAG